MADLAFVGLSDDGLALVLSSPDGHRHRLPIDERLMAALRVHHPPGSAGPVSGEPLRPRDIQARIRAGATAEEVAELAGWDVERVRRFEGPILQERTWVAEQARSTELRRPEGPAVLEEVVLDRLVARGVDPESLRWDSWRRDDGRWTVLLAYPAGRGDRVATWVFDALVRTLVPDDDEARALLEDPEPEPEASRLRVVDFPRPEAAAGEEAAPWPPPGATPLPPATEAGPHDTIPVRRDADADAQDLPRSQRRPRRASIPTWDDILFGPGRPDDT